MCTALLRSAPHRIEACRRIDGGWIVPHTDAPLIDLLSVHAGKPYDVVEANASEGELAGVSMLIARADDALPIVQLDASGRWSWYHQRVGAAPSRAAMQPEPEGPGARQVLVGAIGQWGGHLAALRQRSRQIDASCIVRTIAVDCGSNRTAGRLGHRGRGATPPSRAERPARRRSRA